MENQTTPQPPQQPQQPVPPVTPPAQPPAPGTEPPSSYAQPTVPFGQQQVPGQQPGGYYPSSAPQTSGKAVGALVCGILAILTSWAIVPSIILGIVAIVLASQAAKQAGKDGKTTGAKVCGVLGIVFSLLTLVLYLVLGFGALAYVNAHYDVESYSGSSTTAPTLPDGSTALSGEDQQMEAAVSAKLDLLKAKDSATVHQIAAEADEQLTDAMGYDLAELGIDPVAFIEWMLVDFDYEVSSVSDNGDGTGIAYADLTLRDSLSFATTFLEDVQAAIDSSDLNVLDEAGAKALIGELYQGAMDKTTDMTTAKIGIDLVKTGDTWQVDEDSWESKVDQMFGL